MKLAQLKSLAEASRLPTGSRPENEADGVSPEGTRSANGSPSVPLTSPDNGPSSEADSGQVSGEGERSAPVAATANRQPVEDEPDKQEGSSPEEPYGVKTELTPSGIEVYFQAGPERLYRIRNINIADSKKTPLTDWEQVPSPSKILDIIASGALPWWGMETGVRGMLHLLEGPGALVDLHDFAPVNDESFESVVVQMVELLTKHKLTVNHTLGKAQDRGTNVHNALEAWAEKGTLPNPDVYPPDERGYIEGLSKFLVESKVEPVRCEFMVGSLKHGYAGRPDLVGRIEAGTQVVVNGVTTKGEPRKKPVIQSLKGGDWLLDLKTSKNVYAKHFLQMEGYEAAQVESGYDPTDIRGVIHVTKDGIYELVPNRVWDKQLKLFDWSKQRVFFGHFLAIFGAYRALEEVGK